MKDELSKPQITFLLSNSSIFHLGAWRNSIKLWDEKGYNVKLIQFSDSTIKNFKNDSIKLFKLIEIPFPIIIKGILYINKLIFRNIISKLKINYESAGDGIAYMIYSIYYVIVTNILLIMSKSEIFIAGDPPSLLAAYLSSLYTRRKIIYWSLELLIEKELPNFGMKIFKKIERRISNKTLCLIEFGEKRCQLLRIENKLPISFPIFSIPNSRIGRGTIKRNYYFNNLYDIPKSKKIILYAGGILSASYKMSDLWNIIDLFPEDYVLIVHTFQKPNILTKRLIPDKIKNSNKIYINYNPVPYKDIDLIYSSADIGILMNGPTGKYYYSNHYYCGLSVGKLFNYTYNGVPIIARNLFGYKELIEGNGIGLCFNNPIEIFSLIKKILNSEQSYKKNCLIFNDNYRFGKYHEKFVNYLLNNYE